MSNSLTRQLNVALSPQDRDIENINGLVNFGGSFPIDFPTSPHLSNCT